MAQLEGVQVDVITDLGGKGEGLEGAQVSGGDAVEEDELVSERAEGRRGRRKRKSSTTRARWRRACDVGQRKKGGAGAKRP